MNACRVCLASETNKDIHEIQTDNNLDKTFVDVMLFCLEVQITQHSTITTKLCSKCYRKIMSFYKFKCLALRNDAYLKNLNCEQKNEVFLIDEEKIKLEPSLVSDGEIKNEFGSNDEQQTQDYESDDEVLSVIKNIKYEYIAEETKENEPVKRKRGRPKKLKRKAVSQTQICEECGKIVKNLKNHMLRHQPAGSRKRHQCNHCNKTFSSFGGRYKHIRSKHLGIKQHCKVCDKEVSHLRQHMQLVHNTETLPFQCIACKRRFISKSRLEAHMLVHTKDRPYQCEECSKRFRSKATMGLHRRQVHEKEKSQICHICTKRFFKKYHLQLHIRSHTKEKPYDCPDCGKSFSTTSILKNHQMIHADVKKFGCTLCDMTFVRSGYLRAHMQSHTKEKRFVCQYCGVKFHRSDHRKRHEYTAHQRHLTTTVTCP